jgi:hypothetical protein
LRVRAAVVLFLATSGCAFERAGTGNALDFDDSALDTASALDTSVSTVDAAVAEAMADEGIDTYEAPPPTGSLEGASAVAPTAGAAVDLTLEGTLDWAHWGLVDTSSFDHKRAVGLISNVTVAGTTSRYTGLLWKMSWDDGEPTLAASDTPTAIYLTNTGTMTFRAAADEKAERVLRVYGRCGTTCTSSNIRAKLSDSSAPEWTSNIPPAGSMSGIETVFTFKFRAATSGQHLEVRIIAGPGNTSLAAATLSAK